MVARVRAFARPSTPQEEVEMAAKRRKASITQLVVWTFALIEAAAIGYVLWQR